MTMRLLLTGGGTGGHVYPALTVLDWLCGAVGDLDALYLGSARGMEKEIVNQRGLRFAAVASGAIRGRGPVGVAHGALRTATGVREALAIIDRFRPDVVLATGGYVSTPAVVAARVRGVGAVVYLPDVAPGWAVRALARIATVVATTVEDSRRFLPAGKVVVTGYPTRAEFVDRPPTEARVALRLDPDAPTVVVTGGSSGAQRINDAIMAGLPNLTAAAQVLHITGRREFDRLAEQRAALPDAVAARYHAVPYFTTDMPLALAAADLIISRAGASIFGEYPMVGRASLLIPGPFSSQAVNAEYLRLRGAAETLPPEQTHLVVERAMALLADRAKLTAMAEAARRLAKPDAAAAIGRLVIRVAGVA
ncbi:MAG: UDP-N-acetylglucosamine--N-acetylmuramyl-(pentapeptide) pyrophosphoryl-undecaprenol N-acetylglucosamine transferase [Dehalococcoidia bacterium]|nr:UDP-N-acetylglucosamine--N-acetylmuramyl-(pentapeptide) pyrophosphoryl-undecaprenol N-acetylglucosamine transferase [Dehalococcoidia bacterium]